MALLGRLPNHYGTLGINRDADEATIRRSYGWKVKLWHPETHPTKPELADEKMCQINAAFETLGNPQKRSQYDRHILALERWSQGLRVDTSGVQPQLFIPKEFMMCPVGHPDKFVRCFGASTAVHSREETNLSFNDFFGAARISASWLPSAQGVCRLRAGGSAAPAGAGSLGLTFPLTAEASAPQVTLSVLEEPQACFAAVASPDFQGAFRFEAAYLPGQYLVFEPPARLCVAGAGRGERAVADFVLVDSALTFRYMSLEEVLVPLFERLGGDKDFVNISAVRDDKSMRLFFGSTLQRMLWAPEDFEAYFEGHYQLWDYDARNQRVRMRSRREQLAHFLRTAKTKTASEVVAAVAGVAGEDLSWLPLDTAEAVLSALEDPPEDEGDAAACGQHQAAQQCILAAIPVACRKAAVHRLLDLHTVISSFGGRHARHETVLKRGEVAKALARLAAEAIREHGLQGRDASLETFGKLCRMPLDWGTCGEKVRLSLIHLFAAQPLEALLPLLRGAVEASAHQPAAAIAALVQERLPAAAPALSAETIEALVSGGFYLQGAAGALWRLTTTAPFESVASAVAALGEKDVGGDDMSMCTSWIGGKLPELQELPASILVRLTVAGTKSMVVAAGCLDVVARAAAATLDSWSMDDVSKLLLAAARAKCSSGSRDIASLFTRAAEVVTPQLPTLSATQLIKILLAIGKVPACWPLLDAAAREAAARSPSLPSPQLLLLTQGLLPLGPGHPALVAVLELWAARLAAAGLGEAPAEAGLAPEQLARLLQLLAPTAPGHAACSAAARRLAADAPFLRALGPMGRASLAAALEAARAPGTPEAAAPALDFPGRSALLAALRAAVELEEAEAAAEDATKLQHALALLPEDKSPQSLRRERVEEKKKGRKSRSRGRRRKKKKKSSSSSSRNHSRGSSKSTGKKRKKH